MISGIIQNYVKESKLKKVVSILGWSFKKDTNDSRESSSIFICYDLIKSGFKNKIYDLKIK